MQPDNLPPQPNPGTTYAPNAGLPGGGVSPYAQYPVPQAPTQAPVKPNSTNYAAAVFFTLLIVGFTFNLPALLYVPMTFFCIAAGILFFRDVMSGRSAAKIPQGQAAYYGVSALPQKKRSPWVTALLVILAVIGVGVTIFVCFIVLMIIALSRTGF